MVRMFHVLQCNSNVKGRLLRYLLKSVNTLMQKNSSVTC